MYYKKGVEPAFKTGVSSEESSTKVVPDPSSIDVASSQVVCFHNVVLK